MTEFSAGNNASIYLNNDAGITTSYPTIALDCNRVLIGVAGTTRVANSDSAVFEWPEMIIANGSSSAAQITAIEDYLRAKYGHY
jgi:hypothetical protein